MTARFTLLTLFTLAVPASAQFKATTPVPAGTLEAVAPAHRDAVAKVLKSPTVATRATEPAFPVHLNVYAWMLDHPDRVSSGWNKLQVPCVDIVDAGGKFRWVDDAGSELAWQKVGTLADGVIWYATGKVKPNAVIPLIPVRAVVIVRYPHKPTDDPLTATVSPEATAFVCTDSRAANAVLRVLGPAAPRTAEQAAEQLLFFFSGVAKHLHKNPAQIPTVLAPKAGK